MQNPNYETIYGVSLLDDLHNYFPALLYDQGRFQTVNQIFHYIRTQMSERFNLFALGAQRYASTQQPQVPQNNPIVMEETIHVDTNVAASAAATTLLLSLLGGATQPHRPITPFGLGTGFANTFTYTPRTQGGGEVNMNTWTNFLNPVVFRPSAADISRNTELVTGTQQADTSCAICQDMIRADDTARRLRPCRHVYHQTCIDQWFERSVFCPTCRHDIREPPAHQ